MAEIAGARTCTCHPDEAPVPCQRQYALSECLTAEAREAGEWGRAILAKALETLTNAL
jgi:hypothetical protein